MDSGWRTESAPMIHPASGQTSSSHPSYMLVWRTWSPIACRSPFLVALWRSSRPGALRLRPLLAQLLELESHGCSGRLDPYILARVDSYSRILAGSSRAQYAIAASSQS